MGKTGKKGKEAAGKEERTLQDSFQPSSPNAQYINGEKERKKAGLLVAFLLIGQTVVIYKLGLSYYQVSVDDDGSVAGRQSKSSDNGLLTVTGTSPIYKYDQVCRNASFAFQPRLQAFYLSMVPTCSNFL